MSHRFTWNGQGLEILKSARFVPEALVLPRKTTLNLGGASLPAEQSHPTRAATPKPKATKNTTSLLRIQSVCLPRYPPDSVTLALNHVLSSLASPHSSPSPRLLA